jgi:SAM-dependent methyltransferase
MNTYSVLSIFFLILASGIQGEELTFKDQNYFIKKNYISRTSYHHADTIAGDADGHQMEVYQNALKLAQFRNYNKIGDIGCGSGFKLLQYFGGFEITGFEIEPTLSFLVNRYPNNTWKLSNFDLKPTQDFDLIICVDVVEHLVDPDTLLNWISRMKFKHLLISTPDRDCLVKFYGKKSDSGPPEGEAHVREWNFDEFERYVGQYFKIVDHFHGDSEWWGQTILATPQ